MRSVPIIAAVMLLSLSAEASEPITNCHEMPEARDPFDKKPKPPPPPTCEELRRQRDQREREAMKKRDLEDKIRRFAIGEPDPIGPHTPAPYLCGRDTIIYTVCR